MNSNTISQSILGWTAVVMILHATAAIAQEASSVPPDRRHVNIHVIGFDVDEATAQQLTAMAQAGGGRYYPAENEAQLSAALGQAAGVSLAPVLASENEGNSTLGQSNVVAPTGSVRGSIDPKDDTDWYLIEVDRPGVLHISIVQVPASLEIITRVYNAERAAISGWIKPLRAGAETTGSVDIPAAGKYYVQLEDDGRDAASPDPYTLELRYEPGDAFEPNDSFGLAAKVSPDGEFYGSLQPLGDKDWFTFEVARRGALHVAITRLPENIEAVFRAYDANGNAITGWIAPLRAGAENIAVVDLPAAGRYYLHIEEANNDARNPAEYVVKLHFEPGDRFEPNGTLGEASAVDATTQLFGSILPKADHDWYVLEVDHPGVVNVKIGNVAANQDLTFRVYNRERSAITGWVAPLRAGADNEAVIDLPITGHYYLELVDGGDDERSSQEYSLELKYARADGYEPNGSFGSATDIGIGQAVSGSILPQGDHDWYAFVASQQVDHELAVTGVPPELDIHLRVYNADGNAISGWLAPLRAGAETRGTLKIPAPGRYLIEVADGKDDARSADPYTLTVSAGAGNPSP